MTSTDAEGKRIKRQRIMDGEIEMIRRGCGQVTAELLVERASDKKSPIHRFFEWDDVRAGHLHRLETARRYIMMSVHLAQISRERQESKTNPSPVLGVPLRAYLLPSPGDGVYKPRGEVLSNKESRAIFIERKLKELQSWCESVRDVEELDRFRLSIMKMLERN